MESMVNKREIVMLLIINAPVSYTHLVALGDYFERFIKAKIAQGRDNNASEVIRAGLRLLEENESRTLDLQNPAVRRLSVGFSR